MCHLEEEVELGKVLLEQSKKDADSSKEECKHVMENLISRMDEAKD